MTLSKKSLQQEIESFIRQYPIPDNLPKLWETPLLGLADAKSPYWDTLKKLVHPKHDHPQNILKDATVVLVYFIPFSPALAKTNMTGALSSPEWAHAYELTNAMFPKLNKHLIDYLEYHGIQAAESKKAGYFDREEITSQWSYRHIAWLAGLGTFGLNNMLITKNGCCGRLNAIVTTLPLTPDQPQTAEYCLYKKAGTCKACIRKCPAKALNDNGFDRRICFDQCLKNASMYTEFGSSYAAGSDHNIGSEVCGKCVCVLPCTFQIPGIQNDGSNI